MFRYRFSCIEYRCWFLCQITLDPLNCQQQTKIEHRRYHLQAFVTKDSCSNRKFNIFAIFYFGRVKHDLSGIISLLFMRCFIYRGCVFSKTVGKTSGCKLLIGKFFFLQKFIRILVRDGKIYGHHGVNWVFQIDSQIQSHFTLLLPDAYVCDEHRHCCFILQSELRAQRSVFNAIIHQCDVCYEVRIVMNLGDCFAW